ncbi:SAM-dependent methyltransferase, partial [Gardnerella swidsinskii]|nr:SAM-dependent methyltransferase [Gardnerella swidsinskii]
GQDKEVVRLHTGDASLYGSIREQIEELKKREIDFAVIPGVSSFLGAAAAIGTEYTVPEVSQSLIITRMAGRTPVPEK